MAYVLVKKIEASIRTEAVVYIGPENRPHFLPIEDLYVDADRKFFVKLHQPPRKRGKEIVVNLRNISKRAKPLGYSVLEKDIKELKELGELRGATKADCLIAERQQRESGYTSQTIEAYLAIESNSNLQKEVITALISRGSKICLVYRSKTKFSSTPQKPRPGVLEVILDAPRIPRTAEEKVKVIIDTPKGRSKVFMVKGRDIYSKPPAAYTL